MSTAACPMNVWNHTNGCDCASKMTGAEQTAAFPAWGSGDDDLPPVGSLATAQQAAPPVESELVPEEPDVTYTFGEEGCLCPKCQTRVDYPHDTSSGVVQCPNPKCGLVFNAGYAEAQCGNCREFLDDPDAEDDSLCDTCAAGGRMVDGEYLTNDEYAEALAEDIGGENQYGVRSLTEDDFDAEFGGTVESPDGSHVWEDDPASEGVERERIWTVVEGDNGGEYLVPGHRRVNRIGYAVSQKPWHNDGIEVTWSEPGDDSTGSSIWGENANGGMTLIAQTEHGSIHDKPAQQPQKVRFEWEPDGSGSYSGSSSDGWGSRALIVPPEAGDGETFYWQVKQNGWTWDGRASTLEEAQEQARAEANRMLDQQEAEGIDWDAEDDDDEDDGAWF